VLINLKKSNTFGLCLIVFVRSCFLFLSFVFQTWDIPIACPGLLVVGLLLPRHTVLSMHVTLLLVATRTAGLMATTVAFSPCGAILRLQQQQRPLRCPLFAVGRSLDPAARCNQQPPAPQHHNSIPCTAQRTKRQNHRTDRSSFKEPGHFHRHYCDGRRNRIVVPSATTAGAVTMMIEIMMTARSPWYDRKTLRLPIP
jgi:hypothetical protein